MTLDEAGGRIEGAIKAYGPAAVAAIERILSQVKSDLGQEAVNELIDRHDLELRYNFAPNEFDLGSD
ncbi:MAG TPA: hypothetical protein VI702_07215 [Nitrospiria bacterium]